MHSLDTATQVQTAKHGPKIEVEEAVAILEHGISKHQKYIHDAGCDENVYIQTQLNRVCSILNPENTPVIEQRSIKSKPLGCILDDNKDNIKRM